MFHNLCYPLCAHMPWNALSLKQIANRTACRGAWELGDGGRRDGGEEGRVRMDDGKIGATDAYTSFAYDWTEHFWIAIFPRRRQHTHTYTHCLRHDGDMMSDVCTCMLHYNFINYSINRNLPESMQWQQTASLSPQWHNNVDARSRWFWGRRNKRWSHWKQCHLHRSLQVLNPPPPHGQNGLILKGTKLWG